ncbi:MAG: alpha/beta hydrolase [Muribaculaceae bacterium]|nr:alpha/beta hydrolase [Muribaculaceae bacterium]
MEEAVLAALAPSKKAAEPVVIRLWDDRRPSLTNGISEKEEKADNDNWIAMVAKPELYVYPAEKPTGMALLMCPGGGYAGVAISHEGKEMAGRMNKAGVALAVLKYRMPNGHAGVPVEDVREALRILRERGREWGIEPSKIGIGGASAGGHLASTVATHPEAAGGPVAFQVLLYPVISMKDGLTHEGSRRNLLGDAPTAEAVEYYSNELHVGSSTPQAFIVVSGDDDVVPAGNSFAYYNALRENGVAASLHVYPSGGHGWGMRPDFEYSAQWIEELTTWLQRTGARLRGQDAEK